MGGRDKGLLEVGQRPLVARVIDRVRPQVGDLLISANRHLERYRALGFPVVEDRVGAFLGPLAGLAAALQAVRTPFLLSVPCDSPCLPLDLASRLLQALNAADAEVAAAHDGERTHPVFALLRRDLRPDLLDYIEHGGRGLGAWYRQRRLALADFSDRPEAFLNLNTPQDWAAWQGGLRPDSGCR